MNLFDDRRLNVERLMMIDVCTVMGRTIYMARLLYFKLKWWNGVNFKKYEAVIWIWENVEYDVVIMSLYRRSFPAIYIRVSYPVPF